MDVYFRKIDKNEKSFLPIFCLSHSLIDCVKFSLPSLDSQLDKWLQDFGRGLQNKKILDKCIPSAPPFVGSEPDFKETAEQISAFKAHGTPSLSNSSGSATKNEIQESRSTTGHGISNQSTRFVCVFYTSIYFV